jgi:hypothetical protein
MEPIQTHISLFYGMTSPTEKPTPNMSTAPAGSSLRPPNGDTKLQAEVKKLRRRGRIDFTDFIQAVDEREKSSKKTSIESDVQKG